MSTPLSRVSPPGFGGFLTIFKLHSWVGPELKLWGSSKMIRECIRSQTRFGSSISSLVPSKKGGDPVVKILPTVCFFTTSCFTVLTLLNRPVSCHPTSPDTVDGMNPPGSPRFQTPDTSTTPPPTPASRVIKTEFTPRLSLPLSTSMESEFLWLWFG